MVGGVLAESRTQYFRNAELLAARGPYRHISFQGGRSLMEFFYK
jgi:hypothetical protein